MKLFSNENGQIKKFLKNFLYNNNDDNNIIIDIKKEIDDSTLEYQIDYPNPVTMSDIIGAFIDNKDSYKITLWISIDKDVLINVTPHNANDIIKYLYERFPY